MQLMFVFITKVESGGVGLHLNLPLDFKQVLAVMECCRQPNSCHGRFDAIAHDTQYVPCIARSAYLLIYSQPLVWVWRAVSNPSNGSQQSRRF
jgi:hypothetical protein